MLSGMKVLKNVFLVLGLFAVVAGVVLLFLTYADVNRIYGVAIANPGQATYADPFPRVLLTVGVSLLGGLLLGLGIGLPRRTGGSVRAEAIDTYKRTSAAAPADLSADRVTETERRTDLA